MARAEDGAQPTSGGRARAPDAPTPSPPWPDLVLIDGGAGQLTAAREMLAELGIERRAAASASPRGRPRCRPRDLLHRRAASPSRCRRATRCSISSSACATRRIASPSARIAQRRKKEMRQDPLDEIGGIGPARKRALLHAFRHRQGDRARLARRISRHVHGINAADGAASLRLFHEKRLSAVGTALTLARHGRSGSD